MAQGKIPVSADPQTGKKKVGIGGHIKDVKLVDHAGKAFVADAKAEP